MSIFFVNGSSVNNYSGITLTPASGAYPSPSAAVPAFLLTSFKETSYTFKCRGFKSGASTVENAEGAVIDTGSRTWNILTFHKDDATGTMLPDSTMLRADSFNQTTVDAFTTQVKAIPDGTLTVLYSMDQPQKNYASMTETLTALGADIAEIKTMDWRGSYLLLCIKGDKKSVQTFVTPGQFDIQIKMVSGSATTMVSAAVVSTAEPYTWTPADSLLAKLMPANNTGLGSNSAQGRVMITQPGQRSIINVINNYMTNHLTQEEYTEIMANRHELIFTIGCGDRRNNVDDGWFAGRFSQFTNWSGEDCTDLELSPELSPAYRFKLTFNAITGTMTVTDTHSGSNNYGAIRYFTVRKKS